MKLIIIIIAFSGTIYLSSLKVSTVLTREPPSALLNKTPQIDSYSFVSGGDGLVAKLCLTLANPGTVACQVHLSMGFLRQEYWNDLLFPSPGDSPDPRTEPTSPALQGEFFTTELS